MSLGTTKLNSNCPLVTDAFPLKIVSPKVLNCIGGLKPSLFKVVFVINLSNIAVASSPL
ncbi:hypothetical protein D3C80_803440 [compost metagenome]